MPKIYGVYTYIMYHQNAGIYWPKDLYAYILRASERILARYNDLFLSISCHLSEMTKETL